MIIMAPLAEKEWTLMIYLASDTKLAPEIITQLKALKQAGFHPDANVIVQFDPNPENAETHIFDINRINKIQAESGEKSKIGFIGHTPNDPFVVNLMTDKLWRNDSKEGPIREQVIKFLKDSLTNTKKKGHVAADTAENFEFDPPVPPPSIIEDRLADSTAPHSQGTVERDPFQASNELSPKASLTRFLMFCSENYPARHYILFILGHGLVVGNDTFLFDEHAPEHFLHLRELREVLEIFNTAITDRNSDAKLELISFHSCSMSSMEVAFELQGCANYMLASQSPSFVGSWPYRQILIRIFNYLERNEKSVKGLIKNIFHYCLYNCYDFLVGGYSCDGCLCDLNKVGELKGPISDLSEKLIEGLNSTDLKTQTLVRDLILLAHLDAQSYFNENYSDQFDFCFRLQQRIELDNQNPLPAELQAISTACQDVMEVLKKGIEGDDDRLIVRSEFVGPAYQYSHGLSVYFPWFKPINSELGRKFWPEEYQEYKFFKVLKERGKTTWSDFLATYFEKSRRQTRLNEFAKAKEFAKAAVLASQERDAEIRKRLTVFKNEEKPTGQVGIQADLLEAFATAVFNHDGQLEKPDPGSSQGAGCDCQSIKNYPPFTREPQQKGVVDGESRNIPVSPTLVADALTFKPDAETPTFVLDGLIE
jgi:hypothetical protein